MKLKATSPLLNGWKGDAEITTNHSASSYGRAVLVIKGEAVGTADAALAGYRIIKATQDERAKLVAAGYVIPDERMP